MMTKNRNGHHRVEYNMRDDAYHVLTPVGISRWEAIADETGRPINFKYIYEEEKTKIINAIRIFATLF